MAFRKKVVYDPNINQIIENVDLIHKEYIVTENDIDRKKRIIKTNLTKYTNIKFYNLDLSNISLPSKLPFLKKVTCSFTKCKELPLWPNIEQIDCSSNKLIWLPLWPNVKVVYCQINKLTWLPLWPNAIEIDCSINKLKKLPNWQKTERVDCYSNNLTELPPWPNIEVVDCCFNKIYKPLPNWEKIKYINCSSNELKELPYWETVVIVKCNNNLLKWLPSWPNVKKVHCTINKLTLLNMWYTVEEVICNTNLLTTLPPWPKVKYVNFSFNMVTEIPLWPNIKSITCFYDGYLKNIDKIPSDIEELDFTGCIKLTYLPPFPKLRILKTSESNIPPIKKSDYPKLVEYDGLFENLIISIFPKDYKKKSYECPICLEKIENVEEFSKITNCECLNNFYHEKCLKQWLSVGEASKCPTCRQFGSLKRRRSRKSKKKTKKKTKKRSKRRSKKR